MVEYFLALVLVFDMSTKAPAVVAPMKNQDACLTEALRRNAVVSEDNKKKGAMYVCLKVEYPST